MSDGSERSEKKIKYYAQSMAGSSICENFCAIAREGEGGWEGVSRGPGYPLEALNHMPTLIGTFLNCPFLLCYRLDDF